MKNRTREVPKGRRCEEYGNVLCQNLTTKTSESGIRHSFCDKYKVYLTIGRTITVKCPSCLSANPKAKEKK